MGCSSPWQGLIFLIWHPLHLLKRFPDWVVWEEPGTSAPLGTLIPEVWTQTQLWGRCAPVPLRDMVWGITYLAPLLGKGRRSVHRLPITEAFPGKLLGSDF